MAHVEKFTKGQISGLSTHIERKTEYHSNKEIDNSKSHLNIDLCQKDGDMNLRLQQRLSEVHCLKRKDVKVMCNWIVTLPDELKDKTLKEQKIFFEKTNEFLNKTYDKKNNISSTVHFDETTPHMHYSFVPVVFDNKKNYEKVSAKEVLTRNHLKSFHQKLDNYLKNKIPNIYQKGILNDKTIGLDKVNDIKRLDDEIKKVTDEKSKILEDLKEDIKQYDNFKKDISILKQEKNDLLSDKTNLIADIEKYKKSVEHIKTFKDPLKEFKNIEQNLKKSLLGHIQLSPESWKKTKEIVEGTVKYKINSDKKIHELNKDNSKLKKELSVNKKIIKEYEKDLDNSDNEKYKLKEKVKELEKTTSKDFRKIAVRDTFLKENNIDLNKISDKEYEARYTLGCLELGYIPKSKAACKKDLELLESLIDLDRPNLDLSVNKYINIIKDLLDKIVERDKSYDLSR